MWNQDKGKGLARIQRSFPRLPRRLLARHHDCTTNSKAARDQATRFVSSTPSCLVLSLGVCQQNVSKFP